MTRQPWDGFRRSTFGDPYLVWHDGADFTQLIRQYQRDPVHVEQMLRYGIDAGDDVAAQAYAELARAGHTIANATTVLGAALPAATGKFKVDVATAMHVLTGDEVWAAPIIEVLQGAQSPFDRLDAAIALRAFTPTETLVDALVAAVGDPEYLVRYHAATSLLRICGCDDEVSDCRDVFNLIT